MVIDLQSWLSSPRCDKTNGGSISPLLGPVVHNDVDEVAPFPAGMGPDGIPAGPDHTLEGEGMVAGWFLSESARAGRRRSTREWHFYHPHPFLCVRPVRSVSDYSQRLQ